MRCPGRPISSARRGAAARAGNRRPPDHLPGVPRHQETGFYTFLSLQPGACEATVRAGDVVLVMGPWNGNLDASLFKQLQIRQRLNLRFSAGFFDVLDHTGLTQPDANTGILTRRTSANTPRILQLTLRLSW
jgi:hypothetical protein